MSDKRQKIVRVIPVETYQCSLCKDYLLGGREEAEKHAAIPVFRFPEGLVVLETFGSLGNSDVYSINIVREGKGVVIGKQQIKKDEIIVPHGVKQGLVKIVEFHGPWGKGLHGNPEVKMFLQSDISRWISEIKDASKSSFVDLGDPIAQGYEGPSPENRYEKPYSPRYFNSKWLLSHIDKGRVSYSTTSSTEYSILGNVEFDLFIKYLKRAQKYYSLPKSCCDMDLDNVVTTLSWGIKNAKMTFEVPKEN